MTTDYKLGDLVRVKPLAATGTVIRISDRMRHSRYLVEVSGCEPLAYAADDLERLPATPAKVKAVRGQSGALVCGACWWIIDPHVQPCPRCGKAWEL